MGQVRHFTQAEYDAYIAALPRTSLTRGVTTNAAVNRRAATSAHNAGKTVAQIAMTWPEVWAMVDGRLAQLYDYVFSDGETYETNRMITAASVRGLCGRRKCAAGGAS